MADKLSLRGGTTTEHATFTGANKEVTVDTTKKTLVVNDGATVGGHPLMRENASNSALALGSAGTPSLKFTGDPNTGIYSPGADQLAVATNGTGRLFIDSSGRVGIGVSNPSSELQIYSSNPRVSLQSLGASSTADYFMLCRKADNTAYGVSVKATDESLTFQTGGNPGNSYVPNERLRITSTGLVGIGTSDAQNLLSLGLGSGTTTRILGQYGNNV